MHWQATLWAVSVQFPLCPSHCTPWLVPATFSLFPFSLHAASLRPCWTNQSFEGSLARCSRTCQRVRHERSVGKVKAAVSSRQGKCPNDKSHPAVAVRAQRTSLQSELSAPSSSQSLRAGVLVASSILCLRCHRALLRNNDLPVAGVGQSRWARSGSSGK